jgi:hypothetical protein
MSNEKLSVGDKYLSVQLEFGGMRFHLPAFKNKVKKNVNEPDYKGQNVAVWIRVKKDKQGDVKEDLI